MKRKGIHTSPTLYLKTATGIVVVLFFLQGIGVSFFSALPETKSRTAVCKCLFAKAQYETKKALKLVASPNNTTGFNTAITISSNVSRSSFSVLLPFQTTVPTRGPPTTSPTSILA